MSAESFLDPASLQANQKLVSGNYWKQRMRGFELASYFIGNKVSDASGLRGTYTTMAAPEPALRLQQLAASPKARQVVLLAALGVLLSKYSTCRDVVVLTSNGIGGGLLPVRMNDFQDGSFRELLTEVRDSFVEDVKYGNYPLSRILGVAEAELDSWPLVGLVADDPTAVLSKGLDLLFGCSCDDGLRITLDYDAGKYDEAYIARVAAHYLFLLERLMVERDVPIRRIELIGEEDRHRILEIFNATERPFPAHLTVMDIFAEQARARPDRIALRFAGNDLTYARLDQLSDRIARRLVGRFPEKGTVIAVRMDRCLEMMIAIYGILKAGCVYLPLSKDYPAQRLAYILENSEAKLLLTNATAAALPGMESWDITALAFGAEEPGDGVEDAGDGVEDPEDGVVDPGDGPVCRAIPEDIAYIIYTSGSTGQPKGVLIRHRSVVNRLVWMQNEYGLRPDDSILQKTPTVFDVSIWELFWAGMYGARLVLAAPGAEKDPVALGRLIEKERVTVLHFVPSMLQVFLQVRCGGGSPESIRYVFTSGEELKIKEARLFRECCPKAELHNLYGPTEATVDVSYYPVMAGDPDRVADHYRIPIGKPIDNTKLYILNEEGQLQPIGVPGELFIGGVNLSAGYLNKEELTKQRFIDSPLRPGTTIYKTGDLARWLPDGNIEFLGRLDHQVKVRGNRIELGEIELAIGSFPAVERAVVLTRKSADDTQLAAYIQSNGLFQEEELRNFLRERVPDYMVPDLIFRVDGMPLTVNGKIDRSALLALSPHRGAVYAAPVTELEKQLAGWWQTVLGIDRAGVNDRFFRIGGDSILAVRLLGAINKGLNVRLSIADILEQDTIAGLARFITARQAGSGNVTQGDLEEIKRSVEQFDEDYRAAAGNAKVEAAWPMSDIETGMCVIHLSKPDDVLYFEQNVIPIDYEVVDIDVLKQAVRLMAEKHPVLRTAFDMGAYAHVVYREPVIDVDFRDLCGSSREAQTRVIGDYLAQSRARHFDIGRLPLWRMVVYRLKEHYHVMVFEAHHAILDGWSHAALITELNNTYGQLLRDAATTVEPLEATYKDHIIAELARKQDNETLNFWRKELDGYRKLELNGRSGDRHFSSVKKQYDADRMIRLEAVARRRGIPVKHLLFAAHVYALKMLTGGNDILTGLVGFNRPLTKDGDKLLGCFLTTVPVRIVIPHNCNWDSYLQLIHERLLEYGRHDGLSFFEICQAIGAKVDNVNPLFDVYFNFINFHVIRDVRFENSVADGQDNLGFENYLRDETGFTVSMHANDEGIKAKYDFVGSCIDAKTFESFLQYYEESLAIIAADEAAVVSGEIDLLDGGERQELLIGRNATGLAYDREGTIVSLFREQRMLTPGKTAVVYEGRVLSYAELDWQSEVVARELRGRYGVCAGRLVGVKLGRSERLAVGLLGILKAGGAYVPLDPNYPQERLEYMLSDSGADVVLDEELLEELLSAGCLAAGAGTAEAGVPEVGPSSSDLCYVIYTSGSTGKPKGVMITHGNVVNFFAGINERIKVGEDERLLAVTSTSFDISVLELFWTLCHGVEIVIHPGDISLNGLDRYVEERPLDFSLFFFSSYDKDKREDKYELLVDAVKYADEAGFEAVWTPERHFHEFGGLYPNPSVLSAGLSMVTRRIGLRSGSVVSPLHESLRIAEEWSVVDNLSGGRIGLSFASGWNPDDFVLSGGQDYGRRQQKMYEQIEEVRKLWRGEEVRRVNGVGREIGVKLYPRPLQEELPVWVTSAGSKETFISAGRAGANVLTHLLGQDLGMLGANIGLYREARRLAGYDEGKVTIMLHTYIGEEIGAVEELVAGPFMAYLQSSIALSKAIFEREGVKMEELSAEVKEKILRSAFLRYYKTGSLIGTKASCGQVLEQLRELGVDEIACLVDFGLEASEVLKGLKRLNEVRALYGRKSGGLGGRVTMLQSTPSFVRMVEEGRGSGKFLAGLRTMLLGGEAVPVSLVRRLQEENKGLEVYNMYGPTETTIWSCVQRYGGEEKLGIGRPLGNQQVYVLDESGRLVADGVSGELYIGGEGLSLGYWGKGELTAERFVENPYRVGERMYRTGDRVRWMEGGVLEYLGRNDQQLKIRGHRIEAGEIESRLRGYAGIKEAVVTVKEGSEGDKVLVGYVVSEQEVEEGELRKYLGAYLPHYMIPGHIVRLEQLPLTLNGKIDRKALVLPGVSKRQGHKAPANRTEERLLDLWAELLKLDKQQISTDKDFFDLGGHSLKAALLLNMILKEFKVEVPLHEFFKHHEIASLARYIGQAERTSYASIAAAEKKAWYPLSSAQRRLYFVNQLDRQSLAYNMPYMVWIDDGTDMGKLRDCFRQLIGRHESLRTYFRLEGDEPVQVIAEEVAFDVPLLEAPTGGMDAMMRALIHPFDLSRAPLMRATLVREGGGPILLVVDMHHIICDGVSQQLLMKDFQSLYQGNALKPLRLQYKDYAEWQRSEEQEAEVVRQKDFWLRQFATPPEMIDLPVDFVRPAVRNYAGGMVEIVLSRDQMQGLKTLADEEDSTPFMVLLSAYSILLGKLSAAEDVVIGTSTAGRQHANLDTIMGMFVNTLPLRTYPRGDMVYKDFLKEIRTLALQCFDHQAYPYEELIDELRLGRDISRNPLFDCMLAYEYHDEEEAPGGLGLRPFVNGDRTAKFDLTLSVTDSRAEMQLGFEYASALFGRATIERLAGYFQRILAAIVADKGIRLAAIELRSEDDKIWLETQNATFETLPGDPVTVLSLIEERAQAAPEAIAVEFGESQQTYGELSELADRIGSWLRVYAGVRRGDLVGVLLHRGLELPAVLLGIWKAGAAFVPVDPAYPQERIDTILAASGATYIITGDSLEMIRTSGVSLSQADLPRQPDTAYVLFTSGSTGVPKGVVVSHRSLLNYIGWASAYYFGGEPCVFPVFTSVSFDLTLTSLFTPLASGGRMVVYEEEEMGVLLGKIMADSRLNGIKLTPSHLQVIRELGHGWLPAGDIRKWIVGGEDLETGLAHAIAGRFPQAEIFNEYGPTEATVGCMVYACTGNEKTASIPIGKPIRNTAIYILDAYGQRVPAGVEGELYVAGEGVAAGYLQQEELTAAKFIAAPWDPSLRFYRTGDVAVIDGSGSMLFRGRKDRQVKLRGYRIELDEIGHQVGRHPEVREAVADLRKIGGESALVVYYVGEATEESLRVWLQGRLPVYMQVSYYCQVQRLPLSANGKRDLRNLPAIERGADQEDKAPANGMEEKLAAIWSELLELEKEKIGVHKSFFELGGHSLKAISMVNRILIEWGVDVPLEEIFNRETIAGIAQYIANELWVKGAINAEAIEQDEYILD